MCDVMSSSTVPLIFRKKYCSGKAQPTLCVPPLLNNQVPVLCLSGREFIGEDLREPYLFLRYSLWKQRLKCVLCVVTLRCGSVSSPANCETHTLTGAISTCRTANICADTPKPSDACRHWYSTYICTCSHSVHIAPTGAHSIVLNTSVPA